MDTMHVDGRAIASVADAAELQPGINALAITYDFALDAAKASSSPAPKRSSPARRTSTSS